MTTQFSRTASAAAETAKEFADSAEEKQSETAEQVRAFAKDQYDGLGVAIRRNPLQAAGIALGIGFALALLARR